MSGTEEETKYTEALIRLEELLDRRTPIDSLNALRSALSYPLQDGVELSRVALGIDSSVFLRLATHPKSADLLDYLLLHKAPIILPGQAIQEFWNNQMSGVQTVSSSVKRHFEQLAKDVERVDAQFGDFEKDANEILDNFELQFGYIYDENTSKSVSKMLEILKDQAHCCFAPRDRFFQIAELRKRTMTPPGFKDVGHGDFFIWTDFLLGLLTCMQSEDGGRNFEKVVLLTNDQKKDWSTNGTPHPILIAEIRALFNMPFDVWNLSTFVIQVQRAVAG